VIAVTGSNGKSTVVAWLGHILAGSDLGVAVAGNIGKPVLDLLIESGTAFDVVVIELSSFQLELVSELNSLGSVVLNISEDHMDRYTSLEAYAQVKARIHANSNHVVLNRTDSLSWPAELPASANVVLFSSGALVSSEESDALSSLLASHQVVQITLQQVDDAEWLSIDDKPLLPVAEIGLAGRHNVDNALAVIALLLPYTLSESLLRERIASFGGLPHRMQLVEEINGVRWFNDSKGTNVDACAKAIDGIAAPVVLLAGGLAKGADFSVLREPVARSVRALVLFGQDADSIAQVLSDLVDCHHVNDMQQAVEAADGIARQGDVVLLSPACASFDMFDSFEHRGNVFIDEVRRLAA